MKNPSPSFRVYKKKLSNGMNVLVRPNHTIPEVVTQVWYNVGSKDEADGERGMAHLIEHMIFKGTKKLSESDIDLISIKLGGYTNAFTSNDYTCYYIKLPSNVWQHAPMILADCMVNARFDEQMLNSEMQAVVQELKLYKDNFQEALIEKMVSGIFSEHPYRHPIIGYKQDLLSLNRDDLYKFYKKHYHPGNATLVVVGDVTREDAFEEAERHFGKIKPSEEVSKKKYIFVDDLFHLSIRLPRHIETPWAFYAYPIPGLEERKSYLFRMIEYLVGNGRSSRLYEKLVDEMGLATSVGVFSYDLFERSLFFIYVQPVRISSLPRIEEVISQELEKLMKDPIEDREFFAVKQKFEMSIYSSLEKSESQAELIGSFFLAHKDTDYLSSLIDNMKKVKRGDLQKAIQSYLQPAFQHKGYVVPGNDYEEIVWGALQERSDAFDREILKKYSRTSKIESGSLVLKTKEKDLPEFKYPVPKTFTLDNGLEVVFHHNPALPKVSMLLGLKANYLYEPESFSGMSTLIHNLFLEGTKRYSAKDLNRYIESHGMIVSTSSGILYAEMLEKDIDIGLDLLWQLVTESTFEKDSIEKVKQRQLAELHEYWDTPLLFVDSIARKAVYNGHPYSKNYLGSRETIGAFSREDVFDFYETYVSPQESVLVIVGDLSRYDDEKLRKTLHKNMGYWRGKKINDLAYPEVAYSKPQEIHHSINRDQTVLAFAAPSVSRLDANYDALSLLDFVFTGAGLSMNSRLFRVREQTGLLYTIGGSLLYSAGKAPGMVLIKTLVSLDKVDIAKKLIKNEVENIQKYGVSEEELKIAIRSVIAASVRIFESNAHMADIFMSLKRWGINLDLFDKRGSLLSIMKLGAVNEAARRYCKENILSTITVGRSRG